MRFTVAVKRLHEFFFLPTHFLIGGNLLEEAHKLSELLVYSLHCSNGFLFIILDFKCKQIIDENQN